MKTSGELPSDEQMIKAAKDLHQLDGEVEIDDNAAISWGDDNGAYVQAWVWVPFSEVTEGENHE